MPRKKIIKKKELTTDPIFNSILIQLLINRILKKGKKQLAIRIVLNTLEHIQLKTQQDALQLVEIAIQNLSPSVEIQTKRIGGAVYSVPLEVQSFKATNLAVQLLLETTRAKSGQYFSKKLAEEIIDASNNMGAAIRKKEEIHRIANANAKLNKKF